MVLFWGFLCVCFFAKIMVMPFILFLEHLSSWLCQDFVSSKATCLLTCMSPFGDIISTLLFYFKKTFFLKPYGDMFEV